MTGCSLGRARGLSLTEHVSSIAIHLLHCFSLRRGMARSCPDAAAKRDAQVSSASSSKSERLGEALAALVVSPFAGEAHTEKAEKIGSHSLHKIDVTQGAGFQPFLTAQAPTSKTPERGEAEQLTADVASITSRLVMGLSLSSPFSVFRFLKRRWRLSANARAIYSKKIFSSFRTRCGHKSWNTATRKLPESYVTVFAREKWYRLPGSNRGPLDPQSSALTD